VPLKTSENDRFLKPQRSYVLLLRKEMAGFSKKLKGKKRQGRQQTTMRGEKKKKMVKGGKNIESSCFFSFGEEGRESVIRQRLDVSGTPGLDELNTTKCRAHGGRGGRTS